MKKTWIGIMGMVLLCMAASGCGGSKKEADKESTEVMQLTITPQATPTPRPEEVHPEAVVSKDGTTMINGYLMESSS